jgi:hypothetical protein
MVVLPVAASPFLAEDVCFTESCQAQCKVLSKVLNGCLDPFDARRQAGLGTRDGRETNL